MRSEEPAMNGHGTTSEFFEQLGGDVVLDDVAPPGPLSQAHVLATRDWFAQRVRDRLTSTGGRPTNRRWTLRRQVPFAPETWQQLKALAEALSGSSRKVAPGQVAALIIESSVSRSPEMRWPRPEESRLE